MIVLHSTAGRSLKSDIGTLRNKGLSYNYLIDRGGEIWKAVASSKEAYHAGNSYGPREAACGISHEMNGKSEYTARCSVNAYTIGISFVNLNDGKDPITLAQLTAATALVKELKAAIPSIEYVTSHRLITMNFDRSGRSRKVDPRGVDMPAFAKNVGLELWEPWEGAANLRY